MRQVIALIVVLLLLGELAPAWAASPREQADTIFRRGRQLYAKGKFVPALKHFQRAQRIYPSYKIELSIAYTLAALKRPAEAAHYLELSLSHAQEQEQDQASPAIAGAQQRLRTLQQQVGSVSISGAPPGATVMVDGESKGQTPLPQRIYLRPGSYVLSVENTAGEQLVSRSVVLQQGQLYLLEVPAAPPVEDSALVNRVLQPDLDTSNQEPVEVVTTPLGPEPDERPFYQTWWFWTAGAAVVGAAVGVVLATQLGGDDRLPQGSLGTIYLDR